MWKNRAKTSVKNKCNQRFLLQRLTSIETQYVEFQNIELRESKTCSGKFQKVPLFLDENGTKKISNKYYISSSTEWCSIDLSKPLVFGTFLWRQDSKMKPLPFKNPKIEFFYYFTEKIWKLKIWTMVDRETAVLIMKISDKVDRYIPRNLDWERWNAEGFQGQDGKRNHFDVSLCE